MDYKGLKVSIVILAIVALFLNLFWKPQNTDIDSISDKSNKVSIEEKEILKPLYPINPINDNLFDRPDLITLPPLDDSDQYFRLEIIGFLGKQVDSLLVQTRIIERIVATIDNLPRGHVAERIRPIGRLGGQFYIDNENNDNYFLSNKNYARYNIYIDVLEMAELTKVVDTYKRYYPLFQKAYMSLGYPNGYFNDRVVEVIDHLLETPEIQGPISLIQPHVLYEFKDPHIEALSSGQKMMLRIGLKHSIRLKTKLRELRELIILN